MAPVRAVTVLMGPLSAPAAAWGERENLSQMYLPVHSCFSEESVFQACQVGGPSQRDVSDSGECRECRPPQLQGLSCRNGGEGREEIGRFFYGRAREATSIPRESELPGPARRDETTADPLPTESDAPAACTSLFWIVAQIAGGIPRPNSLSVPGSLLSIAHSLSTPNTSSAVSQSWNRW